MLKRDPFTTHSPFKEPDRTRRQMLVHSIALAVTLTSPILFFPYGYLALTMPSWQSILPVVLAVGLLVLSITIRRLIRNGDPELLAGILIVYLLIMTGTDSLVIDGLIPAAVAAYILIVIMSGMVLGAGGSQAVALLAALLLALLTLARYTHFVPALVIDDLIVLITNLLFQVSAIFFSVILSRMSMQDLQRALEDATYDLVQANRNLEDASQMKSRFMARTSHELRTPLNSIIGFTDLALREIYGPLTSLQQDGFRRVLGNARRLLALINDILDLSKIEAGELDLFRDAFAVANLVSTVEMTLGPVARKKNLAFALQIAPDMPPRIVGDENRLSQILMNLTDNAIKYTEKGRVSIELGPTHDSEWHIVVSDTGIGIRDEHHDEIFEEFRQVGDLSRTAEGKGVGLGLSITRHLTEMMGGKIKLTSQPGRGSTFEVILPLRVPEGEPVG